MFFDQVLGGGLIATTVLAVTDLQNANPKGMAPFIIGLSAAAGGLAWGPNSGFFYSNYQ